jgi:hypothetical protein
MMMFSRRDSSSFPRLLFNINRNSIDLQNSTLQTNCKKSKDTYDIRILGKEEVDKMQGKSFNSMILMSLGNNIHLGSRHSLTEIKVRDRVLQYS